MNIEKCKYINIKVQKYKHLKDYLLRFFLLDPCFAHFLDLLSAFWMLARFLGVKNCMFTFWEVDPF